MPTSANYYVSPLSASNIQNFGVDVGNIAAQQGGGNGLIFVSVSDNLEGQGIISSPIKTKDNIQVVSVTATNNISAANNLSSSTATIGTITSNTVNTTTLNATTINATSVTASLKGNGSQVTDITASNIPNWTTDVESQFAAGANLNYSPGVYALNDAISLSSITASVKGDGSQVTNITASNIPNFTTDVRTQFSAGQNINITNGTVAFSGILPIANGGTNLSSAGTAGNLLISNGTGLASQPLSQDVTVTSTGVATVKGLYTTPVRDPIVTPPAAGTFLKYGGTDCFFAPVSATVGIGSLQLTADPPQTITANGQTVLPTSAYWRLLTAGNFNAGTINYAGAGLGQILFIQVPIGQAGSVTFNKGSTLALGSNTRKVSAGGSLQLIYDGTRWIEMFFNTSTSV